MSRRNDKQRSIQAARRYVGQLAPELCERQFVIHSLDGPPEAPRYAVSVEVCAAHVCPRGVSAQEAAAGHCDVLDCPLRRSARILLDRDGKVLHAQVGTIHWR